VQQPKRQSKIPEFGSYEEEAAFWDTHEITDFLDELTPVEVRRARKVQHSLLLHLDSAVLDRLEDSARASGVSMADLVRRLVLEKLNEAG
jgi:hypothetical protein